MSIGLLFWGLMLFCAIFGLVGFWPSNPPDRRPFGFGLVVYILIALLGWATFGPALKG